MQVLSIAIAAGLLASGAIAHSIINPQPVPDFHERLAACVNDWHATPVTARGTMTYRQFTVKCLEGETARPISAVAECHNGTTAPANAPGGACAYDGGVDRWLG